VRRTVRANAQVTRLISLGYAPLMNMAVLHIRKIFSEFQLCFFFPLLFTYGILFRRRLRDLTN
jgi:hypothetical protein